MNWTTLRSASAHHLLFEEATMDTSPFGSIVRVMGRRLRPRLQTESTVFHTKSAENRTRSAAVLSFVAVKRYHQYCPVAHALDLIGDRWALLIVRELMLGQRRYTDLADALPGIGTNILAGRLRHLEGAGVVRRTKLPPPAAVTVYELTTEGRALDDVLRSLAQWGGRTMGSPAAGDCWSMYAVHMRFRPDAAVDGIYELRFAGAEVMSLEVRDGTLTTVHGEASEPTLVLEVEPETLHALIEGVETPESALAGDGVRLLTGSVEDLAAFARMFAPVEAPAAAAVA
jgi:DNA-binding HxlR family transcriptional regulator